MRAVLFCLICALPAAADDWPQWLGPKRDSVWRETGLLDAFPKEGPKILWTTKISGGFSGPAVANGKVYIPDYVTKDDVAKEVYDRTNFKGEERLQCLDAKTGKAVWEYRYPCNYTVSYPGGPRCTPTVADGKVYFLGTEGDLTCLDANTGAKLWAKDFKKDYGAKTAIWGYASHPLVEGGKVFCVVGGEGSAAVAFDKDSGKEVWKSMTADEQGYCAPTMIESGGKKQLLIWHATSINALDPETGKKYWTVPCEAAYKMSIMTPRGDGKHLFIGGEGGNGVLMELDGTMPGAKEVWRNKKGALYPINMTPFVENGHMYGVDEKGSLRCVKLTTGEKVWDSTDIFDGKAQNAATAFIVKNGDRFFLFDEKGRLTIAKLTPEGYTEISKAQVITPTTKAFGRDVVWSHPAFADGCAFIRNDREIVCVSLKK
jgi:outer membrane protein assembly factor BamB